MLQLMVAVAGTTNELRRWADEEDPARPGGVVLLGLSAQPTVEAQGHDNPPGRVSGALLSDQSTGRFLAGLCAVPSRERSRGYSALPANRALLDSSVIHNPGFAPTAIYSISA